MWLLAAALSVLIGLTVGLLGGGGSILTLPMLVYLLRVEAAPAIATSLLLVFVTSGVGLTVHARPLSSRDAATPTLSTVRWSLGLSFGAAGMVGASVGGQLAAFIPPAWLLSAFALVILATALAMLLRRAREPEAQAHAASSRPALNRLLPIGLGVGLISGLVGAGGGFLIVPALNLLGGLPMREAIATSLLVLALQSGAGFVSHLLHTAIDWHLALLVTSSATAGSLIGARLSRSVRPARLRRVFAFLVLAMALGMLVKQLQAHGRAHKTHPEARAEAEKPASAFPAVLVAEFAKPRNNLRESREKFLAPLEIARY